MSTYIYFYFYRVFALPSNNDIPSCSELINGFEKIEAFMAKIEQDSPKVANTTGVIVQPEQECQDAQ